MKKQTKNFITSTKVSGEMSVSEFLNIATDLGFTTEKGTDHYKCFHSALIGNQLFKEGCITVGTKHNRGKIVMHYSGISDFKSALKQLGVR
jgi:hypothetical protein